MANPFTARKPWAAALLSFFLSPFIAMLYLGRGRLALIYLAIGLLYSLVCLAYLPGYLAVPLPSAALWAVQLPLTLIGAVHSYRIANCRDPVEPRPWFSRWYALLGIYLLFPLAGLLIRTFLYQPFDTASASMNPSFKEGDFVMVSKLAYHGAAPERGDVIVFRVPALGRAPYLKRIVGLPGERIQMRGGVLYVNGRPAAQRRIADFIDAGPFQPGAHVRQFEETLPGGRVHPILDHYDSSVDNTAVLVVPGDTYFVLGDNRDNSDDSRGGEGLVGRGQIVGRVVATFFADGDWTWRPVP